MSDVYPKNNAPLEKEPDSYKRVMNTHIHKNSAHLLDRNSYCSWRFTDLRDNNQVSLIPTS